MADRIVSVLGYACPDITYSPSLYPITAFLLHFMAGNTINNFVFKKINIIIYKFKLIKINFIFKNKNFFRGRMLSLYGKSCCC